MKFACIALTLALSTSLVSGCAGSVEEPQTAGAAPTKAPIALQGQGVVQIVGDAFADVPLRPEQRGPITSFLGEADRWHLAAQASMTELGIMLADLVAEGRVDGARFDPVLARLADVVVKTRDADRDAIVKVHGLLDHDQRDAIATAIEARLTRHAGEPKTKLPPSLFEELNLTSEQRERMHALIAGVRPAPSPAPTRPFTRQTMFAALREDSLDVDRVAPHHESMQLMMMDPTFLRPLADGMLAILTSEQRRTASDWFHANASQLELAFR